MSKFQEINNLRKSGDVFSAYKMAVEALQSDSGDLWTKRAMSWVIYDLLKLYAEANDFENFVQKIEELKQLNLSKSETMFMENLPWAIYAMTEKIPQTGLIECTKLFNAIRGIEFVPCLAYSMMFKGFHGHRGGWNDYISFCDWWNFDNFSNDDFKDYHFENNGKNQSIMSLVQQAYIGYSNALLSLGDTKKISDFIAKLERLSQQHSDYVYLPYYISKLYLKIEDKSSAFEAIVPFVKSKPKDFWVWQCLGDSSDESDVVFACYSRALTCQAKPQMLVALKLKYSKLLLEREFFNEAHTEIDEVIEIRQKEGWRIPNEIYNLQKDSWYKQSKRLSSNKNFYIRYIEKAEKLIYPDMKMEQVMVIEINFERMLINFVRLDGSKGVFNYRKLRKIKFVVGMVLNLRVRKLKENGYVELLECSLATDVSNWQTRTCNFSGKFINFAGKVFGIVKTMDRQVFISPALAAGLENGQKVSGRAVKMIDTKQNKQGWTALEIF